MLQSSLLMSSNGHQKVQRKAIPSICWLISASLVLGLIGGLLWLYRSDNRRAVVNTPVLSPNSEDVCDNCGSQPAPIVGDAEIPGDKFIQDTRDARTDSLGWQRVMGSPSPNRLFAIAMVSDTLGWAVGDEGAIWRYDGLQWDVLPSPSIYRLYDLEILTDTTGWAVGDYGTILRLESGVWGKWPQQLLGENLHAIAMAGLDVGWAVGRVGTILSYRDGRWSPLTSPTTLPLYDVAAISPTLAFAVGGGGAILTYRGNVWAIEASPTQNALQAVAMNSPTEGWAVGERGTILHYDGAHWTTVDSPVTDPLLDVLIVSSDDVWASGQGGLIIHYDGSTWNRIPNPSAHSLYDLAQAPDGDLWTVGFAATILRYNDGQWTSATRLTSAALRDVVWDGEEGWAVGDDGTILHTDGSSWSHTGSPTTATLYAVTQAAPGDLWAVGEDGVILHYAGHGWAVADSSPTTMTLRRLAFATLTEGWAVGGDSHPSAARRAGTILHYDGATWQVHPVFVDKCLHALAFASPDVGWAVGDNGAIWRYEGSGWRTENSPAQQTLWSVAVISPTNAWAVGEKGVILHYDGNAWAQAPSPTSNGLHKVIMTGPDEGWAMGDSGVILHYDGLAWRKITSPTSYRLLGGGRDNSNTLWAVGNGGVVLRRQSLNRDFQLLVSPEHIFTYPGDIAWITVTVSAISGFNTPVAVDITAPLEVVRPPWSTTIVTPSAEIQLGLRIAPTLPVGTLLPPQGGTLPLTITTSGYGITRTDDVNLTIMPGRWLSGTRLQLGDRLHGLTYDGEQTWVVGDEGLIWRYDGTGWQQHRAPTSYNLYAVDALSPTAVWAVGEHGTLLRFDGMTWISVTSPTTMPLFSLTLSETGEGWAVGGGVILHYDGESWQMAASPRQDWLYDVAMAPDGTGWAVGWGGAIWRYNGAAWQIADSPTSCWLRSITVVGNEEAWAVGSEGAILHYVDGKWQLIPPINLARLFDVHFDGPDDGWAIGGDGALLRYDSDGWHVLPRITSSDLRALGWIGQNYALAVGNAGDVICYQTAAAGTLFLPGCNGEPVPQTSLFPYHVFLPHVGRNAAGLNMPIELFGVHTTDNDLSRDPAIVHQMAEAGIRWIRMPFAWKSIEPTNTTPDRFYWSWYDDWFELLSTAGIRPLPILSRNPSWAGTLPASYIDQSDEAEQREFIAAAAAHYGQPPYNVSHWEMYNEPDNSSPRSAEVGWGLWGNDGAGYAEQLARLYPAIKEANPSAQVLLGGVAHDYFVEDGGLFVRSFVTDVLASGGGNYFDMMNFHYYGPDLTGRIQHFRNILAAFSLEKPIVCTEVSTALGDPTLEKEGELYARYLPKVMARGLAARLPIVNWFMLSDMEGTWRPGLFTVDRMKRPAYRVYQVLTNMLHGARYLRPLSGAEMQGLPLEGYVFVVSGGPQRLDIVWTTNDTTVNWQVQSPGVTLFDKYGGSNYIYDSDDGRSDGLVTLLISGDPVYVLYGQQATPPLRQSLGVAIWPPREIPAQIDQAQALGVRWIRVNVDWDRIEPVKTTPRTYEWQETDRRILSVTLAGINPIGLIGANPSWASIYPGGPVTDTQDILTFLTTLAERYDGDGLSDAPGSPVVRVWEIYNEPDNQDPSSMKRRGYGSWGGHGAEYVQFLAQARAALRSANPTALVSLGGLAHEDIGRNAFDLQFPDEIFGYIREHPGMYFDLFNFHYFPYYAAVYRDWGLDILGKTAYFRAWMDRYGLRWPIIVTEASLWSFSPTAPPAWVSSYEEQARYVPKLYVRSASADIKITVWALLVDIPVPDAHQYALIGTDGTPKPSYNAYQTMMNKLGALHFERTISPAELGASDAEGYVFASADGRHRVYVLWTNTPENTGVLAVPSPSTLVSDKVSSQWPMSPTIPYFAPYIVRDADDGIQDGYTRITFNNSPIYVEVRH